MRTPRLLPRRSSHNFVKDRSHEPTMASPCVTIHSTTKVEQSVEFHEWIFLVLARPKSVFPLGRSEISDASPDCGLAIQSLFDECVLAIELWCAVWDRDVDDRFV
jgi:hypothetical protein